MIKIRKVKGGFEDRMAKICSQTSDNAALVGWFASDGAHPSADGMTYPALAKYHATGSEGVPIRDVLGVALDFFSPKEHPDITRALSEYINKPTDTSLDNLISQVGESFWLECLDTIGNPARLATTSNPTPLVDTGELRSHLSYRTHANPTLKR